MKKYNRLFRCLMALLVCTICASCSQLSLRAGSSYSSGSLNNESALATAELMLTYRKDLNAEISAGLRHTSNVDADDKGVDGFFIEMRQTVFPRGR